MVPTSSVYHRPKLGILSLGENIENFVWSPGSHWLKKWHHQIFLYRCTDLSGLRGLHLNPPQLACFSLSASLIPPVMQQHTTQMHYLPQRSDWIMLGRKGDRKTGSWLRKEFIDPGIRCSPLQCLYILTCLTPRHQASLFISWSSSRWMHQTSTSPFSIFTSMQLSHTRLIISSAKERLMWFKPTQKLMDG